MSEIATKEPESFIAGDTVKWKKSFTDYKATDDYVLKYAAQGAAPIAITAATDGDDFLIALSAATTGAYTPGTYKWFSWVEKDSERFSLEEGYFTIQPNPATATGAFSDPLIQLEKDIAAINAFLGKNYKYANYAINGRSLTNYSIADLFTLRDRLQRDLNRLRDAEKIKRGQGTGKLIRVRFTS